MDTIQELETGVMVVEYDSNGEWQQLAYYEIDDLEKAYEHAKKLLKEYNDRILHDRTFCKSVTIKTLDWHDAWTYCQEKYV